MIKICTYPVTNSPYDQYIVNTPEPELKSNPLLAAGLGAVGGLAPTGLGAYLKAGKKHNKRMDTAAGNFLKNDIQSLNSKADGYLSRLFDRSGSDAAKNLRDNNTDKLKAFVEKNIGPKPSSEAAWKGVKRIPMNKLMLAGGGGAALGLLANKLLVDKQNN